MDLRSILDNFFVTRASVARVLYAKNVFLGVVEKRVFRELLFSLWIMGKVVKVKFVENLLPEILVPNLSGSKHYDPGKAPIENSPGSDPMLVSQGYSIFGWTD